MYNVIRVLTIVSLLGLCCISFLTCGYAEDIILTTYYPAPFGVYNQMRAKKVAIGDAYYDSTKYCWPDGHCAVSNINSDVDLAVEGNISSKAYCDKGGSNCIRFIKGKVDIAEANNSTYSSIASVDFPMPCSNPMVFTHVNGADDFVAHSKDVTEDGFKVFLFGMSGKALVGKKRKHSVDWFAVCAEQ